MVKKVRLHVVLVVAIVLVTASLILAPQAVAFGCEPVGGSCYCPGC